MKSIKSLNECFIKCFANADTFKNAQKTSDIDADISDLINNKIPTMLSDYIKGNYIVCGSVGKGLATKTPWVAILDREITTSTREGVYVVFLFASDFKQVYLTLNQGTTVPGAFGPRLGKKEVSRKSQELRELLKIDNELLCVDGNANIADEKYRAGAIYYTLWDIHDEGKGKDLLALYLNIYKQYKKLAQKSNVKTKSQIGFKMNDDIDVKYRPYITAIKSKPFLLLAGISGTGKSRIVREMARACWDQNNNHSAGTFNFICPVCNTIAKLPISMQGQIYECNACCEKSIAEPSSERPCPYCNGAIKLNATVCKHCKQIVSPAANPANIGGQRAFSANNNIYGTPGQAPYYSTQFSPLNNQPNTNYGTNITVIQENGNRNAYSPSYPANQNVTGAKSRTTYILLALFLGGYGVHNFYAGYIASAILQILLSCLGIYCLLASLMCSNLTKSLALLLPYTALLIWILENW